MSTPNAQRNDLPGSVSMLAGDAEPVTGARFQHGTERPFHNPASDGWASLASFVFAGMTGAGLLVVVFGVYLTRSDLFILVGAATMSLAAMGWVAVALVMIGIIVKRWFTFSGRSDKAPRRAKPR